MFSPLRLSCCGLAVPSRCLSAATNVLQEDVASVIERLSPRYLREMDSSNFDPTTHQRNTVSFDESDGKPILLASQETHEATTTSNNPKYRIVSRQWKGETHTIEWADGAVSTYSREWIQNQQAALDSDTTSTRSLWTNLDEETVRNSTELAMNFDSVLSDSSRALQTLFKYGILFVSDTPVNDGGFGIAAMGAALSGGHNKTEKTSLLPNYLRGHPELVLPVGTDGPMRTLYGTVWSTTSSGQAEGASVADSAYRSGGLPLHTDMSYSRDPPGLQIFTMVQPAVTGGESVFGDGFAVAHALQQEHPDAFVTLATTERTYRCVDQETGWHLEAKAPVIQTNGNGQIVAIRHNDLDRLPDLPPHDCQDVDEFYQKLASAHEALDEILARDSTRLVMSLGPGDTVIVANQVSASWCVLLLRNSLSPVPFWTACHACAQKFRACRG